MKLTSIAQEASKQIPHAKRQHWQRKISQFSKFLIGQRNRYQRKLQRSTSYSERQIITSVLKQLTILINSHVSKDRNNSWYRFIRGLPPGGKKFWKLTRAIKGTKKHVEKLTVDGAITYNDGNKANIIADVFENHHNSTTNLTSTVDHAVRKHSR